MLRWKARANPPICVSPTVFNRVRTPLRIGWKLSAVGPNDCDLAMPPMKQEGPVASRDLSSKLSPSRPVTLTMAAEEGALMMGGDTGGGICSTDRNFAEKSCKKWTDKEPWATQAISKTGNKENQAA